MDLVNRESASRPYLVEEPGPEALPFRANQATHSFRIRKIGGLIRKPANSTSDPYFLLKHYQSGIQDRLEPNVLQQALLRSMQENCLRFA